MIKKCPFIDGTDSYYCMGQECMFYNESNQICEFLLISKNLAKFSNAIYDIEAPNSILLEGVIK